MTEFDEFPDAEAIVSKLIRDYLATYQSPNETHTGVGVHSSLPENARYPLIIVKRIGGEPQQRNRLDTAEMQFDVYGNNKSEARILAVKARIAVYEGEGTLVTVNPKISGFITGVQDNLGLSYLPDPTVPSKDRYTIGVRVFLHR